MALTKKRLQFSKVAATGVAKAANSDYLESIIFAGTNTDEAGKRDILTHGVSFVQAPLDAREEAISGVDAGAIATTNVTQIQSNAQITGGITLKNLNSAISELNTALTDSASDTVNTSKVTLKKVASPEAGWAAQYQLYLGYDEDGEGDGFNTTVGVKINIPKDQFLKEAKYIAKSADDDNASKPADQVYPALRFTWQLDTITGTTGETDGTMGNTDAITYVAVKELVDTYVGYTNKVASVTGVTKVLANSVTGNVSTKVDDTTQTLSEATADAGKYNVTTSMEDVADTNGAGKGIKVTLGDGVLKALAEGEAALDNAKLYADNKKSETEYNLVGRGQTVFGGFALGVGNANNSIQDNGADATGDRYTRIASKTGTLGTAPEAKVTDVLSHFLDAVESNLTEIIKLKNANAATDALVDSMRVQKKEFVDTTIGDITVKNVTLYGDEITLKSAALAAGELGFTHETDLTTAIRDLEAAWAWEEITA